MREKINKSFIALYEMASDENARTTWGANESKIIEVDSMLNLVARIILLLLSISVIIKQLVARRLQRDRQVLLN